MQRDEPNFVATIGDAAPPPPVADPPTTVIAPTREFAAPPYDTAAQPQPHPLPPPRDRPPYRLRRPRYKRVMSRVLVLAVAAGFALYVAGVGGDLFGMLREGASARVVQPEGGSLLRAAGLEAALQGLPEGGRLETLRVSAGRIDARVVVNGKVRLVRVTDKGIVTDLPAPESPRGTMLHIDARAPARMIRTVNRRTNRRPESISHLTLDGRRWQLVFNDGAQFSANERGRDVHRG